MSVSGGPPQIIEVHVPGGPPGPPGPEGPPGATTLTDLTDVTGESGTAGKAPVDDGSSTFPLTPIVTQEDLDAIFAPGGSAGWYRFDLRPDSPGFLGAPGIDLLTFEPGDILTTDEFYVTTPFDGDNPTLNIETSLHPQLNSNGISSSNDWFGDGTITTADVLLGNKTAELFNQPDTIRVWLDNGAGGDPGSTVGQVTILLRLVPTMALQPVNARRRG